MTLSMWSLIGLLLGICLGVLILAAYQAFVYPPLSERYERAKVTATQGINPRAVSLSVRFVTLIVIPLLGFLAGHPAFT